MLEPKAKYRKTSKRISPEGIANQFICKAEDPPGFEVDIIPPKGRGVRTNHPISPGDFVLFYHGTLISAEEGGKRETVDSSGYRFFFQFKGKKYCIDASEEPENGPSLGRLVNHGNKKELNCIMKVICVREHPVLCLFAVKHIAPGDEILYDYGIKEYPWETEVSSKIKIDENKQPNSNDQNLDDIQITQELDNIQNDGNKQPKSNDQTLDDIQVTQESDDIQNDGNKQPKSNDQNLDDIQVTQESDDIKNDGNKQPKSNDQNLDDIQVTQESDDIQNDVNKKAKSNDQNLDDIQVTQESDDIQNDGNKQPKSDHQNLDDIQITQESDDIQNDRNKQPKSNDQNLDNIQITRELDNIQNDGNKQPNSNDLNLVDIQITEESDDIQNDGNKQLHSYDQNLDDIQIIQKLDNIQNDGNKQVEILKDIQNLQNGADREQAHETDNIQNVENGEEKTLQESGNILYVQKKEEKSDNIQKVENNQKQNLEESNIQNGRNKQIKTIEELENMQNEGDGQNTSRDRKLNKVKTHQESDNMQYNGTKQDLTLEELKYIKIVENIQNKSSDQKLERAPIISRSNICRNVRKSREKRNDNVTDHVQSALEWNKSYENETSGEESFDDDCMDPDFKFSDHEDSYVSDSEDSTCSTVISEITRESLKLGKRESRIQNVEISTKDKTSTQVTNMTENVTTDDEKVNVEDNANKIDLPTTTAYVNGKRVANKLHACFYCGKLDQRIGRHLQTVHKTEDAIKNLKELPEKQRIKELDRLRLHGDYKHNIEVLTKNKGLFIVPRRPSTIDEGKYTFEDFLPCIYCKGFYLKTEVWRHQTDCKFKKEENKNDSPNYIRNKRAQSSGILLLQASLGGKLNENNVNKQFMEGILSTLVVDDISNIIRNDQIILKVGENLYLKHGVSQKQYISQEIRLLARLTKQLREILLKPNGILEEMLIPSLFDKIVEAAQSLSGKEETDGKCVFNTPSVALKCGPLLKKCCIVLKGQALRLNDERKEKSAERLQTLIEHKVTSVALRSIKESKRNVQVLLPTTADLLKLKEYLESEVKEAIERLEISPSMDNFQKASAAVLARIIMFNRRRSGEASKILLKDFTQRPEWGKNLNAEILSSLKPLEQELVNRLDMIEIRGKRGRTVPAILTPDVKNALNILVSRRHNVGIDEDNPYLFPRASGKNPIQGHFWIRQFSKKAGLEYPERIGSTNMRKYIATVTQVLNLNEGELEWLSNHLGHTVNVHKEFYRNQEAALELGSIAKMLIAVDSGNVLAPEKDQHMPDDSELHVFDSDVGENDDDEEEENEEKNRHDSSTEFDLEEKSKQIYKRKSNSNPGHSKKRWSNEETSAVKRSLQGFINIMKVPGKADCEAAKAAETCLKDRDWRAIKFFVYNQIIKKKKTIKKK